MSPPAEPSRAEGASAGRRGRGVPLGAVLCALLLGYGLLLHHGLGPPPMQAGDASVWTPSGFLLEALREGPLAPAARSLPVALAVLGAPALLLALAVFLATPSALARGLAASAALATALVLYYAIESPRVWSFFHWRGSACMGLFAIVAGGAATAPLLVASGRRLPLAARGALAVALAAFVLVAERDLTGTNAELPFALSPWPVVPVFGLDVVALGLACAQLAAAAGVAGFARARPGAAGWLVRALALLAAGAGAALLLWLARDALPYAPGAPTFQAAAAAGVLAFGLALAPAPRAPAAWRRRAAHLAWGAALVGLPILAGRLWVQLDYVETREARAPRVTEALARHYAREGAYPERLAELVEAGDLERVPEPAVGFGILSEKEFTYQEFGESYLLEFSAPRWVQCAYNPPFEPRTDDEADEEPGASRGEPSAALTAEGAWSCPSEPPVLW